jgi:hypothetical protein
MLSAIIWDEFCFVRDHLSATASVLGICAAMAVLVVFTG